MSASCKIYFKNYCESSHAYAKAFMEMCLAAKIQSGAFKNHIPNINVANLIFYNSMCTFDNYNMFQDLISTIYFCSTLIDNEYNCQSYYIVAISQFAYLVRFLPHITFSINYFFFSIGFIYLSNLYQICVYV